MTDQNQCGDEIKEMLSKDEYFVTRCTLIQVLKLYFTLAVTFLNTFSIILMYVSLEIGMKIFFTVMES